jgi:hypothetical protein
MKCSHGPQINKECPLRDCYEELVSAPTKGDPETTLLWTNKDFRNLEKGLAGKGYEAGYRMVG